MGEINQIKEFQKNMEYSNQQLATVEARKRQRFDLQPQTLTGMYSALVVSTVDPLNKGRVRWYNPLLVEVDTPVEGLPWAAPVSPKGGFDDCGSTWVPPAGSTIAIFFLTGNREAAHYIGTIWTGKRGADGQHLEYWDNKPIEEYSRLYDGNRGGYNFGDNSGSQNYQPWSSEMYNKYDHDSTTDFYASQAEYAAQTTPHIYGEKTPQKHRIKHVDGDPGCNYRWRRSEWSTGCGIGIVLKDDHLHPAGQWAFGSTGAATACSVSGVPKEFPVCQPGEADPSTCSPSVSKTSKTVRREATPSNPFYKRTEEQRMYKGAPTPMGNKCDLPQSGIHMQSLAGYVFQMDDSVDQPKGVPDWRREFDFGCNNLLKGKMFMKSATGHYFGMHDIEDYPKNRSSDNGIFIGTANGNTFTMGDDTVYAGTCACPPNHAGSKRGIQMGTTSKHAFIMSDEGLIQCSEPRKDGGQPKKHDRPGFEGYCMLRSGYGLQILMKDLDRQDKTANQFIEIMAPQTDNEERGPHMFVMQEEPEGPGTVMLRAGGMLYVNSFDDSVEMVGDEDKGQEANKFTSITGSCIHDTKGIYFNHSDTCVMFAENFIYLIAGTEDQNAEGSTGDEDVINAQQNPGSQSGKTKKASLTSVIVAKDPWVCPLFNYTHYGVLGSLGDGTSQNPNAPQLDSRSKHVFASP